MLNIEKGIVVRLSEAIEMTKRQKRERQKGEKE